MDLGVFLSLLTLDLHLCIVARAIDRVDFFLADEFLSGEYSAGVVDISEVAEGTLIASLGRNFPVTNSDLMVPRVVFEAADIVPCLYVASQCTYSLEQSGPFLIDGYSIALIIAGPNTNASLRRAEFDGPDVVVECLQLVFGESIDTSREATADVEQGAMIILQSSRLELTNVLPIRGWWGFSAKRA